MAGAMLLHSATSPEPAQGNRVQSVARGTIVRSNVFAIGKDTTMTAHDVVRARIDATWADFLASWSGLDDADLIVPGVTGDWSVKDILAHVTTWEDVTMSMSQAQIDGTAPPEWNDDEPWDLDAFNARTSAEKATLSLDEVRTQLADTHDRLLAWLPSIAEDHLAAGSDVEDRLRADTWDHYPEHANAIRAWRESRA
jgi:hypothetical protein